MPITREFVYKEWEDVGTMGLAPSWFEGADPTTGQGVAHDMLEHFKSSSGIVEGECEALGAFVLLRLENGWVGTNRTTVDKGYVLYQDFSSVLHSILDNDLPLPRNNNTTALKCGAERLIQDALDKAFADVGRIVDDHVSDEDERPDWKERLLACKDAFGAGVRAGYRKAMARYRNTCTYEVGIGLFKKIETKVNALLASEDLPPYAKVRISANPNNLDVNIRVYDMAVGKWVSSDAF